MMKCEWCPEHAENIEALLAHIAFHHPEKQTVTVPDSAVRTFNSEAYVVAVDDEFLAREDWTEHPAFATKFGKKRMAAARAEEERVNYPSANIRVLKLLQHFTVVE